MPIEYYYAYFSMAVLTLFVLVSFINWNVRLTPLETMVAAIILPMISLIWPVSLVVLATVAALAKATDKVL